MSNFGLFLSSMGHFKEAEDVYREVMPIQEALARKVPEKKKAVARAFPERADDRESLSFTYGGLANVLRETRRFKEAECFYRKTILLQEEVLAESPRIAGPRWWLALSYESFGDMLDRIERNEEAEQTWQKAQVLAENLVKDFPSVPDYQRTHSSVISKLAARLEQTGQHEAAVTMLLKAVSIWGQATAIASDQPAHIRQRAADALNDLGWVLNQVGEAEKAVEVLVKARELGELLVAQHGAVPAYLGTLARSNRNLGVAFAAAGRPNDALAAISAALDMQQRLLTSNSRIFVFPWTGCWF